MVNMDTVEMESFPLESVTRLQARQLGQALWDWKVNASNENIQSRALTTRLKPYLQYYREMTMSYISDAFSTNEAQALRSHDDLHGIVTLIRSKPDTPRAMLTREYFSGRQPDKITLTVDENLAFNLAVKAILMVDCSFEGQAVTLETMVWRNDQSVRELVSTAFPARDHLDSNLHYDLMPDMKSALRASRLRKVARLSFHGTDDLRNHLRMDPSTGIIEIYHHTAFLKECLDASKDTKTE